MTPTKKSTGSTLRRQRTAFEWAILAVSIVAILAIVAGLIAYGTDASGPPKLEVTIDDPKAPVMVVTVSNSGGTTATEVVAEVTRGKESSEFLIKAVPKGESEEVTAAVPGTGEAKASVLSAQEP